MEEFAQVISFFKEGRRNVSTRFGGRGSEILLGNRTARKTEEGGPEKKKRGGALVLVCSQGLT